MAHRIRRLTNKEIARALQDDSASEDGLDLDDDSLADPDFDPDFGVLNEESMGVEFDMDDLVDNLTDNDYNSNHEVEVDPIASSSDIPGTSGPPAKRRKPEKLTLLWKKKNLELNAQQLAFTGNESLPSDILELETAIHFFLYLFPPELIRKISEETNLYLVQKDPEEIGVLQWIEKTKLKQSKDFALLFTQTIYSEEGNEEGVYIHVLQLTSVNVH